MNLPRPYSEIARSDSGGYLCGKGNGYTWGEFCGYSRPIKKLGGSARYIPSFDEIETFILENCQQGDLLITMGAGDIVKVGEKLLGQ